MPGSLVKKPALRQWLWFVALWGAGVGTLLVTSLCIKLWLR